MSEMDGFEVKRKGKKFEVRCKQCGCKWKSSDWLVVMLKHSKHHAAQHKITEIKTKPHGT